MKRPEGKVTFLTAAAGDMSAHHAHVIDMEDHVERLAAATRTFEPVGP